MRSNNFVLTEVPSWICLCNTRYLYSILYTVYYIQYISYSKYPLQDISTSDEAALESLIENNPSLIKQIHQYFNTGPQVILLPVLQWNYEQMPDFNEDGFYLDYNHIETAHPPLRDRMLYGLNKIAFFINSGVSDEESYFINCENFENLIENVYNGKLKVLFLIVT